MNVTEAQRRLLELWAIRVDQTSVDWSLIARQAQFDGGLDAIWRGVTTEKSAAARRSALVLRRGLRDPASLADKVEAELGNNCLRHPEPPQPPPYGGAMVADGLVRRLITDRGGT